MTAYGQGIPPRWYRDQTAKSFTKNGFAHYMHKALMQVGMIPIRAWNPFDLELPANAEYNSGGNNSSMIFYYDYPSSETFTSDGLQYRPVLCMAFLSYNDGTDPTPVQIGVGHTFMFVHGYRRADRLIRDDFSCLVRLHVSTSNFGIGAHNSALSSGNDLSYGDSCGQGAWYFHKFWKNYAASADAFRTQLVGVRNFHVILGKGGLTVQVGSGVDKTDSNDILSFTVVFGGARIPGRARVPESDPNLNLINPTFILPHAVNFLSSGAVANYWSDSYTLEDATYLGVRPVSFALGCQHDLKIARGTFAGFTDRPGAVRLFISNLENIERPLFPSQRTDTVNSPRAHPSGVAHILQPLVYTQEFLKASNPLDYYQVQDFNVRNSIAPTWFDCWMAPKFRFGDRTAPYGEFVDPTTGLNWFLYRASGINQMVAVEVEAITKYSAFNISTNFTLQDDDYYNLNAGFAWTAGNPNQAAAAISGSVSVVSAWTPTPSTDEALMSVSQTNGATILTFTLEPYTGLPADTGFVLQLELFWRSVSAQTDTVRNPMHIEYSTDNGSSWITLQTIYNTGVSAIPYQNYTQTAELPIYPSTLDNRIRFRLRAVYDTNAGGNRSAGVRAIHVKQYVRTP